MTVIEAVVWPVLQLMPEVQFSAVSVTAWPPQVALTEATMFGVPCPEPTFMVMVLEFGLAQVPDPQVAV